MTAYKLAIFDLDGTILNTLDDLADSVNWMLMTYGYPERKKEDIQQMVGNGLWKLVQRACPEGTPDEELQVPFEEFQKHYQEFCNVKTAPYDGIVELVKKLKDAGYKTAVNTNKKAPQTALLMDVYFPGLFDEILAEGIGFGKKPSPEAVFHILEELQIDAKDAVYIGDSHVDMQTAMNAGVDPVIVSWGFKGRAFMEEQGAPVIVDTVEELEKLLLG